MSHPDPELLGQVEEWFAAGYFELPDESPVRRWSRAVRRRFEHRELTPYCGRSLYPSGARVPDGALMNRIVAPSYSFTWAFDRAALQMAQLCAQGDVAQTLSALDTEMTRLGESVAVWDSPHTVGGRGYTHSIPNYGRVLREGLKAHEERVVIGLASARQGGEAAKIDLYLGLVDVLSGIRTWHGRILDALERWRTDSAAQARQRDVLVAALRQVPFGPARSFYEAVVAYNFVFYLDDCDNPGRLDRELDPYYRADIRAGILSRESALDLLRRFTDNVSANDAWSAAIGGSLADGTPAYNEVTALCLDAVHGRHRPSYELGVRDDMPDSIWDAALDAVATGCGQPAFYNEAAYLEGLRDPCLGVHHEDAVWWNGGGCTETMIHGCSNVGSLDAGIHLPLILEATLKRCLPRAPSFEWLLSQFRRDANDVIEEIVAGVNALQQAKARYVPQPMRTLLIDDCVDRGVEFNAGGARYNWSVVNVAGLANVADSLAAVREVVFDRHEMTGVALLRALERDFAGDEGLRQRLRACPRFGNDLSAVDVLASEIAQHVFDAFRAQSPWRGGCFLPSCIMFTTYAAEGEKVGAMPDGRRAGEPLADSIGPVTGRDRHGPTAMLRSVTRLPLSSALGTPVLNIRFAKALFESADGRKAIRDLITTYFGLGGLQIQLSVVDRDVLADALVHPEQHEDLIVRVGGFSAYFNGLTPALKQAILERTEYTL
ncbi:MAG: hypothetical protein J7M39_03635 [Anaerolineae bacterium]|nr:hypothetical protein [Anaerolineae bacterium]